jgi:enoyl-[acyl-carrier protein] reductase II
MKNRVCGALGIEKPVMAASMNWLSDAKWCAAVSNAGGLGNLGVNCGQSIVTFDVTETIERFRGEIRKTRELTDKPFSVTYFLPSAHPGSHAIADPFFKMMCEEKVDVVFANNMMPVADSAELRKLKDAGFKILYRDINPTLDSLLAAEDAGVDVLIATGYEAGGHMPVSKIGLISLVQEVRDKVKAPLAAAGGIVNAIGARAAAAMGAEGVYVGTRLLVTAENPASNAAKQKISVSRAEDLVDFRAAIGYLRTTRGKMSEECVKLSNAGADNNAIGAVYADVWRAGMLLGDIENGFVSVSDAINSIRSIKTCKEVVDELSSAFQGDTVSPFPLL